MKNFSILVIVTLVISSVSLITIPVMADTCANNGMSGPETVMWKGLEWQRCTNDTTYNWEEAKSYCSALTIDGHSDWYLPTKDELKSLVTCSNGHSTPLQDWDDNKTPEQNQLDASCCDNFPDCNTYNWPTIDSSFMCHGSFYWSSTEYDSSTAGYVHFMTGISGKDYIVNNFKRYARCVREGFGPPIQEKNNIYGIFITGSELNSNTVEEIVVDGARLMRGTMLNVLPEFEPRNAILKPIPTYDELGRIIEGFKLKNGDNLIFYYTGHGGEFTQSEGGELTLTPGDEELRIRSNQALLDDELYSILKQYNGVTKWVILDACSSGGFWSNKTETGGDLNLLENIMFIAATTEDKLTGTMPFTETKIGILTTALIDGLEFKNGFAVADGNKDRIVSKEEWSNYLKGWGTILLNKIRVQDVQVYELKTGDLITLTPDMLNMQIEATENFRLNTEIKPKFSILQFLPAMIRPQTKP